MTTQDLTDLRELFAMSVLTGDKPDLTKSDCEMVVAAVEELMLVRCERGAEKVSV